MRDFIAHIRKQPGRANLFCVGEFWNDRSESLSIDIFKSPTEYIALMTWRDTWTVWGSNSPSLIRESHIRLLDWPAVDYPRQAIALQLQGSRRQSGEL